MKKNKIFNEFQNHKVIELTNNVTVDSAASTKIKVWTHLGRDFDKRIIEIEVHGPADQIIVNHIKRKER